jgi:FkbM family methyltransferase
VGIGESIVSAIKSLQVHRLKHQTGAIGDFYRNGGQPQLFKNLPLRTDDLVIDGGGYQGAWTDEILCRYGCRSIIFEPMPLFAESLRNRYEYNGRVEVQEVGLSNKANRAKITLLNDGSSIFSHRSSSNEIDVVMIDFGMFLRERGTKELACLKLNIEGGEYDVLEQLADMGLLKVVRCLLVQFHSIEPQSQARRHMIQQILRKTHDCQFDYPFVWERWDRKSTLDELFKC